MNLATRLNVARRLARKYWELACKYDGIPASSPFVSFSSGNPYVARQNLAYALLQSCINKLAHQLRR